MSDETTADSWEGLPEGTDTAARTTLQAAPAVLALLLGQRVRPGKSQLYHGRVVVNLVSGNYRGKSKEQDLSCVLTSSTWLAHVTAERI